MNQYTEEFWKPRQCFCKPVPEVYRAAELLSMATDAVLACQPEVAKERIREADFPALRDYMQRLSGSVSPEIHRVREVADAPPHVETRVKLRMPSARIELSIYERDGWHCRFCGCPVIAKKARKKLHELFPDAARWGRANADKHFGLATLESTLDHLLPHSRGGDNSEENLVTACGPCQFGRGGWTIEEVGLENPLHRPPLRTGWDGLVRLL